MAKNTISIITVSLNSAGTIERTVQSVLGQRGCEFEYIVIDGGSDDGTTDIIKKYESGIAYWASEPDGGIYEAMNKGVAVATGEIIAFLNSDDYYIDDDCLQRVANLFVANPTVDIIAGRAALTDENGLFVRYRINRLEAICYHMPCNHQTAFVKRALFGEIGLFDTKYRIAGDYDWLLRAYHQGSRFMMISEVLVIYSAAGMSGANLKLAAQETYQVSLTANPPQVVEAYRGSIEKEYRDSLELAEVKERNREILTSTGEEIRRKIFDLFGQFREICVFGCGARSRECLELLKHLGIKCNLIIDNDEAKWIACAGFKVAPISALDGFCGVIIITPEGKEEEIARQIEAFRAPGDYKIIYFQRIMEVLKSFGIERGGA
ncbi:MAG: glycosyltransferase [Lachnospiraceae bacterium]|nr:glycosyltransferase [Lachnospiraceae bacterium]